MRTGRNPSNSRDAVLKHFVQKENLPMMVNFFKSGSGYKMFVAWDSPEVKANLTKNFPYNSGNIPGEISHVDRLHVNDKCFPQRDYVADFSSLQCLSHKVVFPQ